MKNKGFTLVELLSVIIILVAVSLLVIPAITKSLKDADESLYETQINNIKTGLKNWAGENVFSLPEEGDKITLTLGELKQSGFIDKNIRNPKTEQLFNDNMVLTIENKNGQYHYIVDESTM